MVRKERLNMSKCEFCGNEHDGNYGTGRFCSPTCARKFSNTFVSESGRENQIKALSGKEKIRSFYITMSLGENAFVEISVITDENTQKEKIFFLDRKTNGVVRIPVNVPPCMKIRLCFKGKGECTVHRIERISRISGEVKNIE